MNTLTDKQLKYLIVETVAHAKNSLLSEDSNLSADILKKMDKAIELSVKTHVNGKIKSLDEKLDQYIIKDNEWKELITPQIEAVKSVQNWGKVSLGLITVLSTIGGFILLTIKLFTGK